MWNCHEFIQISDAYAWKSCNYLMLLLTVPQVCTQVMVTNGAQLVRKWDLGNEVLPDCNGVAEWRSSSSGKGMHWTKPVEGLIHIKHPGVSEKCYSNDTSPFQSFWQCPPTGLKLSLKGRPRTDPISLPQSTSLLSAIESLFLGITP